MASLARANESGRQAHLVHVDSVGDVSVAMADLLRDKKVANATHNIAAYRIVEPDGRLVRTTELAFVHFNS